MKLKIGSVFAEFGRSRQRSNVIDIRAAEGKDSRVMIGLLAEAFDSALSFYIHVSEYMTSGTKSTVVELRGWNVRRLSAELESAKLTVKPELYSKDTVVYPTFPLEQIGQLFNAVWLACNIRIFGLQDISASYRDALTGVQRETLPKLVDFVIEKQSLGTSDFLSIRCDSDRSASLVTFLRESATDLKHPLLESRLPF